MGPLTDVNELRDPMIALHGLEKADEAYTIYYDETNNIRRLHVRADGLNEREPKCFVIAGVAHKGQTRPISIESLRTALKIQPGAREIKLKHIATGGFLDILAAPKLTVLLDWLSAEGLYVHFSVLDPLFWSIVDIMDSIVAASREIALYPLNRTLKSDLYTILRHDYEHTVDLFRRYTYPDVGPARGREFIAELQELAAQGRNLLPAGRRDMLQGVLQIATGLDSLPFLENETANVLIETFGPHYLERISMLKNASHIFDAEEGIQAYLDSLKLVDGDKRLSNYRFAKSHDETGIQLSDVLAGTLGKFFTYICVTGNKQLIRDRQNLSAQQAGALRLLAALLDHAMAENSLFAHYVLSDRDREAVGFFLDQ